MSKGERGHYGSSHPGSAVTITRVHFVPPLGNPLRVQMHNVDHQTKASRKEPDWPWLSSIPIIGINAAKWMWLLTLRRLTAPTRTLEQLSVLGVTMENDAALAQAGESARIYLYLYGFSIARSAYVWAGACDVHHCSKTIIEWELKVSRG